MSKSHKFPTNVNNILVLPTKCDFVGRSCHMDDGDILYFDLGLELEFLLF